jgi:hypothetical protein
MTAKAPAPEPIPRKDGLDEIWGTWGDLTVGMVIEANNRKWTVTDSAMPAQFQYGSSVWFKFRAANGEETTYPPQSLRRKVKILREPGTEPPKPTLPEGCAEAALLVEMLGATEIATIDTATGIIWCPDYTMGGHATEDYHYGREEILHLRLAHGIDTSGIEAMELGNARTVAIATTHGGLHDKHADSRAVPGRGFPHRHPEHPEFF